MSENDGKIHTVYMRDPLKIKSQNLPYKKTDLYGEISRGLPGPCRDLVLVANSLLWENPIQHQPRLSECYFMGRPIHRTVCMGKPHTNTRGGGGGVGTGWRETPM